MISDLLKRKGSKSTTMVSPQESKNPTNKNTIEFVSPFNDNTIESVTTGKDAIFLEDNRKTRHNKIHTPPGYTDTKISTTRNSKGVLFRKSKGVLTRKTKGVRRISKYYGSTDQ